ncbi:uncharacterized protein EV422DRAFT_512867 [Fimicolochytrium jonesii]|uniref:uncharacterized protein n=1 Tax=Fimicolochytrium jonesii TaxID=1396493 RepID=UPI0022FECD6C|nr:uncharacterized protein EV422DRAFT_512867 [Fimicolochytrium jonesii]KAI8827163.1 hypothetical protein EV422DRAFT_512867 [Fimicolochytrium jonesii]
MVKLALIVTFAALCATGVFADPQNGRQRGGLARGGAARQQQAAAARGGAARGGAAAAGGGQRGAAGRAAAAARAKAAAAAAAKGQGKNNNAGNAGAGAAAPAAGAGAAAPPAAKPEPATRITEVPITQFATAPFCGASNLTPSDGTQIRTGACSSTALGAIPDVSKMVSTIITSPANLAVIDATKDTLVAVDMLNLDTGFFADPNKHYNQQPQTLNRNGITQGHQHISVQPLVSGTAAPDPTKFAFFKGLNDESKNGKTLTVTIPAGTFKTNGVHRMCSMSGTDAHQPPIMPVTQRGPQDDCIRVTVQNAGGAAA